MSCPPQTLDFTHRTWARTDNSCNDVEGYTQTVLDMRRKAEILQYKGNSMKLTKREKYAQIAKGHGPHRKTSWASQSFGAGYTNSNTHGLTPEGNTLTCSNTKLENIKTHSSASDVPGNTMLSFDMSVPLTRYRVRRMY